MKKIVKKIKSLMIHIIHLFPLPLRSNIILESHPDLTGNTFSVFKLMLKYKLNEKYKLIWLVNDKDKYIGYKVKNVCFENINPKTLIDRIRMFYLKVTAKCIVFENRSIQKLNKKQFVIYLSHATPIKDVRKHISIGNKTDFVLSQSDFLTNEIIPLQYNIDKKKLVSLGFPRNDDLYIKNDCIRKVYPHQHYDKVVIWMPTFRQHNNKVRVDSDVTFKLGIPIIKSILQMQILNVFLKERDMLLILKPHPAQDISYLKTEKYSNFDIIYDEKLTDLNIKLYEFIGQTDALITDYSSIYFDYLLTDKPIALTIDDLKEYQDKMGLAFDNYKDIIKGEYINTFEEILKFLENISNDFDNHKLERKKIKDLTNKYQDNNSSERVLEFIYKNAKL